MPFMKRVFSVIMLFCLWSAAAESQSDFRPGYVIRNSGDTLFGEIDYRGDLLMSSVCRYRQGKKDTVQLFSPADIQSFRFINGKYFVSKYLKSETGDKKVFLEFLVKGKLDVYYYRDDEKDHYLIENDDLGITELPYTEGIKYSQTGVGYFYQSTQHFGIINTYLKNDPRFRSEVSKIKKPEHRNLIDLAEDYHKRTCKDETCIVYAKKVPWVKINMEIAGGVLRGSYNPNADPGNSFHGGCLIHIWSPRTNEKIYIRSGLLYSTLIYEDKETRSFKIPIHIEYRYPKGIIRPAASYGINFFMLGDWDFFTVSLNTGLMIKLDEKVFVTVNSDFNFKPDAKVPIVPDGFLMFSVLGGLLFYL
jgi:hypothetical protein